jgi:hypothetical protein
MERKRNAANDLEEELDFDEVMSDDENPDFGIEDADEAKEARKREFGDMVKKAKFEEDEVEDELDERKRNRVDSKNAKVERERDPALQCFCFEM